MRLIKKFMILQEGNLETLTSIYPLSLQSDDKMDKLVSLFLQKPPKIKNYLQTYVLEMTLVIFCQNSHLVFLDSHVEVTKGWLEPLAGPILKGEFIFSKLK